MILLFLLVNVSVAQVADLVHAALQINDFVSDVLLTIYLQEEKTRVIQLNRDINSDLNNDTVTHSYSYNLPTNIDPSSIKLGLSTDACDCSSHALSQSEQDDMRLPEICNVQREVKLERPLFLIQTKDWTRVTCENCPGSRYAQDSPSIVDQTYTFQNLYASERNKFCNPNSFHDPFVTERVITILHMASLSVVLFSAIVNMVTLYGRWLQSYGLYKQRLEAWKKGGALDEVDGAAVMTANIATTTVLVGICEDAPQLVISIFYLTYLISDGGIECLQCFKRNELCTLSIDPTASVYAIMASHKFFYVIISSLITIAYTAGSISYGILCSPVEDFEFLGVPLLTRFRGYLHLEVQKFLLAIFFPIVYCLALVWPASTVCYFFTAKKLKKEWFGAFMVFLFGSICITFFLVFLLPHAAKRMWENVKGNIRKAKKVGRMGTEDLAKFEVLKQVGNSRLDDIVETIRESPFNIDEIFIDKTAPKIVKSLPNLDARAVTIVREILYNDQDARECVHRLVTVWTSEDMWNLEDVSSETRDALVERLIDENIESKLREAVPELNTADSVALNIEAEVKMAEILEKAQSSILEMLREGDKHFTEAGAALIHSVFYGLQDPEGCLRVLIQTWAENGDFGLRNATQDMQDTLVENLLAADFEDAVLKAFPPPQKVPNERSSVDIDAEIRLATVLENAQILILQSLNDRENYKGDGMKWINHAFYELGDPPKCLRELVKFWVKDGKFELKDLPESAQETLIENLLQSGFEERIRATFPPPKPKIKPKHEKPGFQLAWQTSKSLAAAKGGRLCTVKEAQEAVQFGPLYPGEDQWVAVGGDKDRDWVQIGDLSHSPGTKHSIHGYPPWGDNPNDLTFGVPTWNQVLLWMPLVPVSKKGQKSSAEMKDLQTLRKQGLLTESEFWGARAQILGRDNSFFE